LKLAAGEAFLNRRRQGKRELHRHLAAGVEIRESVLRIMSSGPAEADTDAAIISRVAGAYHDISGGGTEGSSAAGNPSPAAGMIVFIICTIAISAGTGGPKDWTLAMKGGGGASAAFGVKLSFEELQPVTRNNAASIIAVIVSRA
jgi:hypothetical protein